MYSSEKFLFFSLAKTSLEFTPDGREERNSDLVQPVELKRTDLRFWSARNCRIFRTKSLENL